MFNKIIYSYKVIDNCIHKLPDNIIANYKGCLKEIYNVFADPRKINLAGQSLIQKKDCHEDYVFDMEIGRGSQGKVFLARHKETQERVAVKQMQYHDNEMSNKYINVCIWNGVIYICIELVILSVKSQQWNALVTLMLFAIFEMFISMIDSSTLLR